MRCSLPLRRVAADLRLGDASQVTFIKSPNGLPDRFFTVLHADAR
jgi:hypothetical protein